MRSSLPTTLTDDYPTTRRRFRRRVLDMALQSLQITAITAMRARDVSRPTPEEQKAADDRPLRDETPRRDHRRDGRGNSYGRGGSSPVAS